MIQTNELYANSHYNCKEIIVNKWFIFLMFVKPLTNKYCWAAKNSYYILKA
jgi:hypothetical protein